MFRSERRGTDEKEVTEEHINGEVDPEVRAIVCMR